MVLRGTDRDHSDSQPITASKLEDGQMPRPSKTRPQKPAADRAAETVQPIIQPNTTQPQAPAAKQAAQTVQPSPQQQKPLLLPSLNSNGFLIPKQPSGSGPSSGSGISRSDRGILHPQKLRETEAAAQVSVRLQSSPDTSSGPSIQTEQQHFSARAASEPLIEGLGSAPEQLRSFARVYSKTRANDLLENRQPRKKCADQQSRKRLQEAPSNMLTRSATMRQQGLEKSSLPASQRDMNSSAGSGSEYAPFDCRRPLLLGSASQPDWGPGLPSDPLPEVHASQAYPGASRPQYTDSHSSGRLSFGQGPTPTHFGFLPGGYISSALLNPPKEDDIITPAPFCNINVLAEACIDGPDPGTGLLHNLVHSEYYKSWNETSLASDYNLLLRHQEHSWHQGIVEGIHQKTGPPYQYSQMRAPVSRPVLHSPNLHGFPPKRVNLAQEGQPGLRQSESGSDITRAARAERDRLCSARNRRYWEMSQRPHAATEECERRVQSYISELDRLRLTKEQNLDQRNMMSKVIDIVQAINEQRCSEPSGCSSNYSRLVIEMVTSSHFGVQHGAFGRWMGKKDVTLQHAALAAICDHLKGNSRQGEVVLQVTCSDFKNGHVLVKQLKQLSLESFRRISQFYSRNMISLISKVHHARSEEERSLYKEAVATCTMEATCMTYFFSLQNPSHYRCSQNWVLEDVPPLIDLVDKARAMERLRDKLLEVGGDLSTIWTVTNFKLIRLQPWKEQERGLRNDLEEIGATMLPGAETWQPQISHLLEAVSRLKEVMDWQRAIEAAARTTVCFAALDPYQLAEVACAAMPHLPDIQYLLEKGMLPCPS